MAYMQIDSLQEYVLIEQDIGKIAIMRRSGGWITESYYLAMIFYTALYWLNSIGCRYL